VAKRSPISATVEHLLQPINWDRRPDPTPNPPNGGEFRPSPIQTNRQVDPTYEQFCSNHQWDGISTSQGEVARCSATGKVTVGLTSHRPCVTNSVVAYINLRAQWPPKEEW